MDEVGWRSGELLGLDLETTGIRRHVDVPVSFALVRFAGGRVVERRSGLIDPGRSIPAAATAIHGITTEHARGEGMALPAALELVAEAVLGAGAAGVPVVGMNLSYDLSMVDHQLRSYSGAGLLEAGWRGPALDVLVLDRRLDRYRPGARRLGNLCAHYGVVLTRAHEASADAEAAVTVLLALCDRFPHLAAMELAELTRLQATWHREWVARVAARRAEVGDAPLEDGADEWPLARPAELALGHP